MAGDGLKLKSVKKMQDDSNLSLVDLRMEVHQLCCTIEEERMVKQTAELLVKELRTEISGLRKQMNPRAVTLNEDL